MPDEIIDIFELVQLLVDADAQREEYLDIESEFERPA